MTLDRALHPLDYADPYYIECVNKKSGKELARLLKDIYADHEEEVAKLKAEIERLKEFEFMYEGLCK